MSTQRHSGLLVQDYKGTAYQHKAEIYGSGSMWNKGMYTVDGLKTV